jgi:anti-sigma regulatory factor (Ser/Thr protein kinase)
MAEADSSEDTDLTIDFSNTKFVSPLFVLSLLVYLSGCGKRVSIININDYLLTIGMQNFGVRADLMRITQFIAFLERFSKKTYIPIIAFPADSNNDKKEAISSVVENKIINQSNIASNVAQGIKYMIAEILDNITEHSESPIGYIFAQAYPQKGYLDICIADQGIGLLGSYKKVPNNEIIDDMEAMKAANRRISSKNRPEAESRGYGIWTSKRMLVEGLGGQYLMVSGNSFYHKGINLDRFISLPEGLRWNGTLVALRIPTNLNSSFKYYYYTE